MTSETVRGQPVIIPAKHHLSIDLETYSSVDIGKSGVYKYVESDDFEILLFSYSLDHCPVQTFDLASGEKVPVNIIAALADPGIVKHAWNAAFEITALSKFWPTPVEQWQDDMVHGLYLGLTAALGQTAKVLGLPENRQKMTVGKALIRLFCKPVKPTKTNGERRRIRPQHEPEKWAVFKKYNAQDVEVEMTIEQHLSRFPVPQAVWDEWHRDQRCNAGGIQLDEDLIAGALYIDRKVTSELKAEAKELTGLSNPNSTAQLTKWLADQGVKVDNLQKDTVDTLIGQTSGKVKRALEIRRQLSKTSIKKYKTMHDAVCSDGRIRGTMQFYGANRSGRWAGRLLQPQNMKRNKMRTLDLARNLVREKKLDALRLVYADTSDVLSQLTRTAIIAAPGHKIAVADFNAIEARVVAWLSGEKWRLDVFNTHGKIYEASASQMFNVPLESIHHDDPIRQQGKVAELALGYGGGVGAMKRMDYDGAIRPDDMSAEACKRFAAENGISMIPDDPDKSWYKLIRDEMIDANYQSIIRKWRAKSPNIVRMWRSYENAALSVMRTGRPAGANHVLFAHESDIINGLDFLTIQLPSGRKLYYCQPFISDGQYGDALYYHGMDQVTHKWSTISTWGGKLVENVTQAIARDCLAVTLHRLDDAGYQVVMTIHDEVVCDVPEARADVNNIIDIMRQPIDWAPGLPLNADGFVSDYYKKD